MSAWMCQSTYIVLVEHSINEGYYSTFDKDNANRMDQQIVTVCEMNQVSNKYRII